MYPVYLWQIEVSTYQSDKYLGVVLDNRLSLNKRTGEIAIK